MGDGKTKESLLTQVSQGALSLDDFVRLVTSSGNSRRVKLSDVQNKISPTDNIADAYSTSTAYTAGDIVVYDGRLYEASVDTAAGDFNPAYWTGVSLESIISSLKGAITQSDIYAKLQASDIPGTTQTYVRDSDGKITQTKHMSGSTVIRSDVYTRAATTFTEVRTLNTGQKLTLVTNKTTKETTVTYSAS